MTPYDPAAIAKEAAEQIMALNYPTTPAIDNLSGIILTAAARMVRESGAESALEGIAEGAQELSSMHGGSEYLRRRMCALEKIARAALDNLKRLT